MDYYKIIFWHQHWPSFGSVLTILGMPLLRDGTLSAGFSGLPSLGTARFVLLAFSLPSSEFFRSMLNRPDVLASSLIDFSSCGKRKQANLTHSMTVFSQEYIFISHRTYKPTIILQTTIMPAFLFLDWQNLSKENISVRHKTYAPTLILEITVIFSSFTN